MFQRRVSGAGGLAVDCLDYSTEDGRVVWVVRNGNYYSLRSKLLVYSPISALEALDTGAGLDYFLGDGIYGGMVWTKIDEKTWIIVYSLSAKFYLLKVDMSSEEPLDKRPLPDMFGAFPNIFKNGDTYLLAYTHYVHNYAYLVKTKDWESFETPRPANLYKNMYWDTFTLVNNPGITLRRFYSIHAYARSLNADPVNFEI